MAIQRFTLVGARSSRDAFTDYVFTQLLRHKPLKVYAREQQDDLARRRSPAVIRKFTMRIREMHTDPVDEHRFFFVFDQDDNWIRVDAYHDEVAFDLIS